MAENPAIIHLDTQASPAILAGVLGINVSSVNQGRQTNMLPPNSSATYRQCIQHYVNHWKQKSSRRASSISEAALMQKMKLDAAKTESEWQNIKQKKEELIDVQQLAETFEPVFLHIRTQLVSLSRKFPEIQTDVDRCLEELCELGERTLAKGKEDLDGFIDMKMNAETEFPIDEQEEEDTPLSRFDDYVPLEDDLNALIS